MTSAHAGIAARSRAMTQAPQRAVGEVTGGDVAAGGLALGGVALLGLGMIVGTGALVGAGGGWLYGAVTHTPHAIRNGAIIGAIVAPLSKLL